MSTLRKDPLTQAWVIIAPERFERPPLQVSPTCYPSPEDCPFCPGHEEMTPPEILAIRPATTKKDTSGWSVRAIPNQFAVLRIEGKFDRRGEGIYDAMNGVGAHEVIIETPQHDAVFYEFTPEKLSEVLRVYRDRTIDLMKDQRFRYIQIFRNYGEAAGANITHPHSQIIALPILPRHVRDEISQAYDHWTQKERCLFCDIINQDAQSPRLVHENHDFIALEPYASKSPFETWIYPKEHSPWFHTIPDVQLGSLGQILKVTLSAFAHAMAQPAYNLIIHSAPLQPERSYHSPRARIQDHYHWHIEIVPRVYKVAGFEYGTGFYINSVPPEDAAEYLRQTIKEQTAADGIAPG